MEPNVLYEQGTEFVTRIMKEVRMGEGGTGSRVLAPLRAPLHAFHGRGRQSRQAVRLCPAAPAAAEVAAEAAVLFLPLRMPLQSRCQLPHSGRAPRG